MKIALASNSKGIAIESAPGGSATLAPPFDWPCATSAIPQLGQGPGASKVFPSLAHPHGGHA